MDGAADALRLRELAMIVFSCEVPRKTAAGCETPLRPLGLAGARGLTQRPKQRLDHFLWVTLDTYIGVARSFRFNSSSVPDVMIPLAIHKIKHVRGSRGDIPVLHFRF